MNLSFTDEQNLLRDMVSKFCSSEYDFDTRMKSVNSEHGHNPEHWKQFENNQIMNVVESGIISHEVTILQDPEHKECDLAPKDGVCLAVHGVKMEVVDLHGVFLAVHGVKMAVRGVKMEVHGVIAAPPGISLAAAAMKGLHQG